MSILTKYSPNKAVGRIQGLIYLPYRKVLRCNFSTDPPSNKQDPSASASPINNPYTDNASRQSSSPARKNLEKPVKEDVVLSPQAQKALWASKVILTISKAKSPASMSDTLYKKIMDVSIDQSKFDFQLKLEDKYKEQILTCFNKGVLIDSKVFKPERIELAKARSDYAVPKLIFYPTTVVSRLVFKCLVSRYNYFVHGSFGIGKSISFVLYIHLTSYINRLSYLSFAPWIPEEKRNSFNRELTLLRNNKLLIAASKCWYINIARDCLDNEKSFMQSIKAQTKEMSLSNQYQTKVDNCTTLQELVDFLKKIKLDDIYSTIVIDQINSLTSSFRNWNSSLEDVNRLWKMKKENEAKKLEQIRRIKYYQPANKLHNLLLKTVQLGRNYILNSSLMVEQELLMYNNPQLDLYLQVVNHGDPTTIRLPYSQIIRQDAAQIEFNHFFHQLLIKSCRQAKASQANIEKINTKFNLTKVIRAKTYFRPLFIRQYFSDPGLLENKQQPRSTLEKQLLEKIQLQYENLVGWMTKLTSPLEDAQIDQFISYLSEQFEPFCLLRSKIKMVKFMAQGVDPFISAFKRLIIHTIRNETKKLKEKKQESFIIQARAIEKVIKAYRKDDTASLKDFLLTKLHNNELLPCYYQKGLHNQLIVFDLTVDEFLEISDGLDAFQIKKQWLAGIPQPLISMMKKNPTTLGNGIEMYAMLMLFNSSGVKFKERNQYHQYFLSDKVNFLAFNLNFNEISSKMSLTRNLKELLEKSLQNPDKYFMGTPVRQEKDGKQFDAWNSKGIDWIFAKYEAEGQFFDLKFFDVTIKDSLGAKLKDLQELARKLIQKNQNEGQVKLRINIVFLCLQKNCKASYVIMQDKLTVSYHPLDSMEIIECKHPDMTISFKLAMDLIKKDTDKD